MIFWRQWLGLKSVYGYWSAPTTNRFLGVKEASQALIGLFPSHTVMIFSPSLIDTLVTSIKGAGMEGLIGAIVYEPNRSFELSTLAEAEHGLF